jgi:transcriptional regulator with XRE-family HTH domain
VAHALTAAELAAYLGMTPSAVRQTVRRHRIPSAGKRGRAAVYDPQLVLQATKDRDRRPFQCEDCDYVTWSPDAAKEHLNNQHPA